MSTKHNQFLTKSEYENDRSENSILKAYRISTARSSTGPSPVYNTHNFGYNGGSLYTLTVGSDFVPLAPGYTNLNVFVNGTEIYSLEFLAVNAGERYTFTQIEFDVPTEGLLVGENANTVTFTTDNMDGSVQNNYFIKSREYL